jgi:hypothetical protein
MKNQISVMHINGKYYVYSVTVVENNIYVNFDRVGV